MEAEGVVFKTNTHVGKDITAKQLLADYDSVVLAMGAERPRDLSVPGRELKGIHFAMNFLTFNNKQVAGDNIDYISAKDKHVIVIGGGDTGSDCVGTSNRHGAKSVTQIELFPEPPKDRDPSTPWPLYPKMLRTSSSQEEGNVVRKWSINTLGFRSNDKGEVTAIRGNEVRFDNGKMEPIPGTEFEWPADLVFLAMGFVSPIKEDLISQVQEAGLELDKAGNVKASFGTRDGSFATSVPKVYACGDVRRGQSLIVWAISEGRKCADQVNKHLLV
jgi:glutamate synthase (NADPH/NADH) small chain